jgi:hypothetical protein
VDEDGVLNGRENGKKFVPYFLLPSSVFSPKAVLLDQFPAPDPQADKVIEVAIGHPFNIQVNRRSFDPRVWCANHVNFLLSNC